MEKIIDCKGMACPLPVVNAKKASEELHAADTLTVLVDNEIAVQNLSRFAEHKGFGVCAEKNGDAEYAVIMTISGEAAETQEEEITCAVDSRRKGMLEEIACLCKSQLLDLKEPLLVRWRKQLIT